MEYVLKNDCLDVSFCTLGGALNSIKDKDGVEYLWQGDANYWSGQAPVLFPICGSLRDDKAKTKSGKIIQMPRHGIVRKREFKCVECNADSILFSIESDKEMFKQFPYHFGLDIRYTLNDSSITTEYIVKNLSNKETNEGNEEMPFFIGGHPGFNCPIKDKNSESYEDYKLIFEQKESCTIPTPVTETGLINIEHRMEFLKQQSEIGLTHEMFAKDAIILDSLSSRSVTLCTKNHEKGLKLDFKDFPYLILWSSANSGPFIALEPWTGLSTCSDESDIFEEKRNIQTVKVGEKNRYSFTINILH